jgi:phosphatidylglycerol:prolipoprotein diacylglycerol transferase
VNSLATILAIPFPDIGPNLIEIGPVAIRWYALSYIAGLMLGWQIAKYLAKRPPRIVSAEKIDDFLLWAAVGVVLGGRMGYVLFYKPLDFLANPLEIFAVWHGGMSFHGGLLGSIAAIIAFAWRHKLNLFAFSDIIAFATPPGLFFGRIANFINGELWGRASDVPWAMVFPHDKLQIARHPSQLYQALLEGALLFAVLVIAARFFGARRYPGVISGLFLAGYAAARLIGELFREPDAHLGFIIGQSVTMGQLLSLPPLLFGVFLIWRAMRKPALPA